MNRSCAICIHNKPCWARIEVARTIHGFKLLADNAMERENCGTTHTTGDIYAALAGACAIWEASVEA